MQPVFWSSDWTPRWTIGSDAAKVWVLWVPVSAQRDDVGYTDKAVELEARTDKKTPTSRNIQELKEQMVFTEDDINLFDATGIEVPGPVPARPVLGPSTGSTPSNSNRRNTRRGNTRSGSDLGEPPLRK